MKDADDGCVGGEYAESNRGDYGSEEQYGHKKRDHGRPTFMKFLPGLESAGPIPKSPSAFLKQASQI